MKNHIWLKPLNNNQLSVYQYGNEVCEPRHMYGPYVRDHFLIHFVNKGCGRFALGNISYSVKENQGFIIYPDEITYYEADFNDPWDYSWIGFNGGQTDEVMKSMGFNPDNPIFSFEGNEKEVKEIFEKIKALNETSIEGQLMRNGYLYMLFSVMKPIEVLKNQQKNPYSTSKEYVGSAIEFIKKNYANKISVNEISDYIGLNRSYFGSIFKKHTKMTPQEFIIDFRFHKAIALFENPKLNISDIARSVGYDDAMLFSKIFKKKYGVSPTIYRENLLND